jgi:hypothetical protein
MPKYRKITTKDGRVMLEHRKVMEDFLGRKLKPEEIVHHKNRDGEDNRIENLEVVTHEEHVERHLGDMRRMSAERKRQRRKEREANSGLEEGFEYKRMVKDSKDKEDFILDNSLKGGGERFVPIML